MYCDNGTELTTSTNSHLHIINRSSGKNCSTSSTDSGVGLVDNAATFKAGPTTKESSPKSGSRNCEATTEPAQTKAEATTQNHISIEVEATVNISNTAATAAYRPKKSSPTLSVRSTTISIVSIDENAIDSSCIDSDSEAEPDESCTVQKLGQQITHPPHSAELTQLNKGMTVISRQVLPTGGAEAAGAQPTPPDVVAKQLLNGNLSLATPTAPAATQQIGSIALSNTTDVTFGDKHYYEGPVTIQQILIDNREKWKTQDGETGGQNPGFNAQGTSNGNAAGGKVNESCKEPVLCPFLPSSITMKAVFITAAFALFTVGLLVVLATTTNIFSKSLSKSKLGDGEDSRLNIPINSKIVLSVAEWGGRKPKSELTKLVLPVHRVIISHTAAEGCETRDVCESRVQIVQNFHMDGWNWDHIGYNFLVGGDGLVYEGRGWDVQGAHTKGYNTDSIGISFIGTFVKIRPSDAQLYACQKLLEEGVRLKKLAPDYKLYGHRQLSATESPGDVLYRIIQTWPHWTNKKPT
ncbi:peptidoglycan-recognition protein LC isoform X7 [Drosophila mojavensis]|uniref:peptidoglycan-recognition protein LC isoform X7 n=1 Tax=Drosophila mojavensis TaxID=7230 RepID=UPI001CD10A6E|nr:peptidoglycan-recognition protein LC isoform X7 [Drosophila mojavensis]